MRHCIRFIWIKVSGLKSLDKVSGLSFLQCLNSEKVKSPLELTRKVFFVSGHGLNILICFFRRNRSAGSVRFLYDHAAFCEHHVLGFSDFLIRVADEMAV
jgi:hypothetical protein